MLLIYAALAELMSDAWIAFARNGKPNTPALPEWSPQTIQRRSTAIFDDATPRAGSACGSTTAVAYLVTDDF